MRTLFAVVASQGTRFSHSVWEECLWQMLFPLLRSVHHTAATSSREEVCCMKTLCSKNAWGGDMCSSLYLHQRPVVCCIHCTLSNSLLDFA